MWFLFAIITTLIWGLAELFYKKGANEKEKYSHLKTTIFVGIVMGIHAIFILLTQHIGYDFKNIIVYLPVSFCYIFSMSLSFFGMKYIEESISDPIENTSGAITSILCFLILGQTISGLSILGIVAIVIGILLIGILEMKSSNPKSKKLGKKLAIVAFLMPFLYAIFDAIGSFLDAYYLDISCSPLLNVTEDTIELVANTSYELTFLISAILLTIFIVLRKEKIDVKNQKDKILAAICETTGQFTYVFAMSGSAIIAAPIISSVCVVSIILSRIFLKEKLSLKQYGAISLVVLGILILAVAEVL